MAKHPLKMLKDDGKVITMHLEDFTISLIPTSNLNLLENPNYNGTSICSTEESERDSSIVVQLSFPPSTAVNIPNTFMSTGNSNHNSSLAAVDVNAHSPGMYNGNK